MTADTDRPPPADTQRPRPATSHRLMTGHPAVTGHESGQAGTGHDRSALAELRAADRLPLRLRADRVTSRKTPWERGRSWALTPAITLHLSRFPGRFRRTLWLESATGVLLLAGVRRSRVDSTVAAVSVLLAAQADTGADALAVVTGQEVT